MERAGRSGYADSVAREGAGVLLIAKRTGRALFLLQPDGRWVLPGGGREHGEQMLEAALRELTEETGYDGPVEMESEAPFAITYILPDGHFVSRPHATDAKWGPPYPFKYRYAAFEGWVDEEFNPEVSDEHWTAAWAPPEYPMEPLHPGTQLVVERWLRAG